MESFGARLKKIRKSKGLSASEIARRLGIAESTYRAWERGRMIKGEPYLKLAQALDVSLLQLFDEQNPEYDTLAAELSALQAGLERIKYAVLLFCKNQRS